MEKQMKNAIAKGIKRTLDMVLHVEANTTSSAIMYQPKSPVELMKFRRNK